MEGTCSTIISSEDGARGSLAKEHGRPCNRWIRSEADSQLGDGDLALHPQGTEFRQRPE